MLTDANVPQYSFSDIKKLVEEVTSLRKENISLRFELQSFKNKVVEARKMIELEQKGKWTLRKLIGGQK